MSKRGSDGDERRKLNWFEKGLSLVNPGAALDRAVTREKLHEFSASGGGGRARGRPATVYDQGSSEGYKKQRQRLTAIWEAREMEERFCIISGTMDRLTQYIAGNISYQPHTGGGREMDREYADYFHGWCGRADYGGRHRFGLMVQLGLRSAIRDGEFGLAEHVEDGELRLQAVEGDRIGNPQDAKTGDDLDLNGIRIDKRGRVLGYDIYRRSVTAQYTKEVSLSPKRFMHLFFPTRSDQYHGVSRLKPALPHARDLYELFGYEKIAAKFASSYAAFVRTTDANGPHANKWEDSPDGGKTPASMKAMAGSVVRIDGRNEGIDFAPGTQRPSGAFIALVEAIIREIATALNLPYGFIYDMSKLGGVSARLESQAVQRVFRWYQQILEDTILNRVVKKVIMMAIATGKLPYVKGWDKGEWRFGATITADVGHQTTADLALVEAGAKTIAQVAAEYDNDVSDIVEGTATWVETVKETSERRGIPMELLSKALENPTQQFAAMERAATGEPGPDDPPPAPPGMIGQVGEKGMKPLLDLIGQVGKGEIDRDTAVLSVKRIYGLTLRQALELVPQAAGGMADAGG